MTADPSGARGAVEADAPPVATDRELRRMALLHRRALVAVVGRVGARPVPPGPPAGRGQDR